MPGDMDFDMDGALSDLSEGLGFADHTGGSTDDVDLGTDGDDTVTTGAPAPAPTADATSTGAPSPAPAPAAPGVPAPAPAADAAPATWRDPAKAVWATLPAEAKQEILKREQDIMQGLEGYKENAFLGKSFKQVVEPYMPILSQAGIDPVKQVGVLMNAHVSLATGSPEQKLSIFQALAKDYGVDLASLTGEAPFTDPAVQSLQLRLNAVESRNAEAERAQATERYNTYLREITAFAADPKNSHFDLVAEDMVHLIKGGAVKSVQEAYDKALWANPVAREKELERRQAETAAAQKVEDAKRVAAAKAATAANIKARPRSGSAAAPLGSIDDTIKETLADIQSRS